MPISEFRDKFFNLDFLKHVLCFFLLLVAFAATTLKRYGTTLILIVVITFTVPEMSAVFKILTIVNRK